MGPKCLNLLLLISSSKLILDAFGQAQFFYHLAVREHDNHNGSKHIEQLHLLRIPKASSSAVSVVARRVVGCDPPGPCCKYPGDPPGTCPSKKLYACMLNNKVIGCTNHNSNYEALSNTSIPSITILRAPIARSLSAFFYPGVHHNSHCNTNVHSCFGEYLHDHRWQNVVTKMLTGAYAYANVATCEFKSQCEHSLQLAFQNLPKLHFAGVAECWELSLLLLHRRFPQLTPELSEFELLAGEGEHHY